MKKKKIISVIAAVAVVTSLAVGSLAYFTSKETVKNSFSTIGQGNEDKGGDAGIDIVEDFKPEQAKNMIPGDTVNKDVQVDSTANYPQFIRVKLDPNWVDSNGKINVDLNSTDKDDIILNCVNTSENMENNKWFKAGDYYYYIASVQPKGQAGDKTARLLDSVTLASDTEKSVLGNGFTVDVTAESVQASNDAVEQTWKDAPSNVIAKLKSLQMQGKTEQNTTTK
ncbi:BsaA family SipW-dependent biofilm matrix protein [Clostridium baratii]|uniref:BsaA family SipW-dependent biofilm matrix protein n=1 Tax=Clostridium baratii TaxID=1561 RepID=UPI002A766247|nr:BsaA family SipW-dependent biofilm matrix protein [Clostridium baratii]MDY3208438.1 BsaA family SipW-dependent biofilm matrix protein [Clostridium baratii]